ncbi:MAG: ACT domain-containing protein [Geminicoccaceae bacterium]
MTGGETDLSRLIRDLEPRLDPEIFVFVCIQDDPPPSLKPFATVREREGLTLVITENEAAALALEGGFPCRRISLGVHSALDAVGLLARLTTALAAEGISVNAFSGTYHDHLLVPTGQAERALNILDNL